MITSLHQAVSYTLIQLINIQGELQYFKQTTCSSKSVAKVNLAGMGNVKLSYFRLFLCEPVAHIHFSGRLLILFL